MTDQVSKHSSSPSEKKEAGAESNPTGQNELRVKVAGIVGKWQAWLMPDGIISVEPKEKDWPERMYGAERVEWERAIECDDLWSLPDYPRDLNACAEFEKLLDRGERAEYVTNLWETTGAKATQGLVMATAEQRCRAFVATMEGRSVGAGSQPEQASGVSSK